jgi:hypothetical protein
VPSGTVNGSRGGMLLAEAYRLKTTCVVNPVERDVVSEQVGLS